MTSNIRRLNPPLRLNERVLRPVRHLARMAGVTPEEIIESLLEEILEGDVPFPAPPARPAPPRHRTPARIIPICRSRRWLMTNVDLGALRRHAEDARRRAQDVRRDAAAARHAASWAREKAARLSGSRRS